MASLLLEFVQNELRESGTSVTKFIEESAVFNRSSFYKIMNQPENITEEETNKLSRALELSGAKDQAIRHIIDKLRLSGTAESRARVERLFYDPESVEGYRLNSEEKKSVDFEIFSDSHSGNRTLKNLREIMEEIDVEMAEDIVIRVQNCVGGVPMATLSELISWLRISIDKACGEQESRQTEPNVKIDHLLTFGFPDTEAKTEFLLRMINVIRFRQYSIFYDNYSGVPVDYESLENSVLIRVRYKLEEGKTENEKKYYVFHFSDIEGHRCGCYITGNRSIYSFHRTIYDDQKETHGKCEIRPRCGVDANVAMATLPYYNRILVSGEPCLDSIPPRILRALLEYSAKECPDKLKIVRRAFEGDVQISPLGDFDFLKVQIDNLERRFNANAENGSINVFQMSSFNAFLWRRSLKELKNQLIFSQEMLREYLLYLMQEINADYGERGKQQFYFYKDENKLHGDHIDCVFKNTGFNVVRLSHDDQSDYNVFVCDKEVGNLLYDSLWETLGEKVMSKELSLVTLKAAYKSVGGQDEEIRAKLGYLPELPSSESR